MYRMTPTRRTRGHAAITNVSPEVRAARAAGLAERERLMQLAAAELKASLAREALEKAQNLSTEHAALDAAMAKLAELKGETTGSKKKAT
jgi:hypothetical protein